jgi:Fic family protein
MNLKEFTSGIYKQQYQYKSFYPTKINHEWTWEEPKINVLLEKATKALGELNAFTMIVPDVDLFIQMHIVKEANTSSRIEGTRTEIDEALMNKDDVSPEKRDDWQEVHNYIQAMGFAIQALEKIPLSSRLLRETHAILMEGVRGEFKNPGEFRRSQNWIGGSNLTDAVYIPPHCDDVPELMSDLEYFWHNENIDVPHLVKAAISHYQFETIHPFLDGNGRIGRLLITLYLVGFGLLIKPSLYLSDFFERRRVSYYDALSRVRESNDLTHWIKFFLNAVIETSEKGKQTFGDILKLKNNVDNKIVTLNRRAGNGRHLMQLLYRQPLVRVNDVVEFLDISAKSANLLINEVIGLGILEEVTGQRRNRLFSFAEYVNLFNRD